MEVRTFLWMCLVALWGSAAAASRRPYIAAALEHVRFGEESDPPQLVVAENLKRYRKAAEIAAAKGADIIVYPEYGIFYPANRTMLKHFLEDIPDPKGETPANPCVQPELYSDRPILLTLSCIARNNSMVVVANAGDIKNCTGDPDCREDGVFHYNTNVVFDKTGTLLLRYYKEHLFFELSMDLPKHQQDPTFETDFGTFATFICFDVVFERMSEVARWPQVDGVMFSTMWFESTPQYVSTALWQAWGMANNATIVVSNIHRPGWSALGSGIFHGKYGTLGYTYNPDGISKVVIAKVPASELSPEESEPTIMAFNDYKTWPWQRDGDDMPTTCSRTLLGDTTDPKTDFRCYEENMVNYTLVKLTEPSGYAEACNHGMCCSVQYSADHMEEDYYLAVYNGSYVAGERYVWCEESCLIVRCDAVNGKTCSTFPRKTNTTFYHVEIKSNFSTPIIGPSVVSSKSRLVPMREWEYEMEHEGPSSYQGSIHVHSEQGSELLNAGFKARCYQRDPPYER